MGPLHPALRRAASRLALMALAETVIDLWSDNPSPQSEATMDQPTSTTTVHPPCPRATGQPAALRELFKGQRTIT